MNNNILKIKLVTKVRRMGSSNQTAKRLQTMSKAAGKFNFNQGTKVEYKLKGEKTPNREDSTKVTEIEIPCSRETAAVYAKLIFDKCEKEGNSEKYTQRKAQFDSVKRQTLGEFGVTNYDELTADERQMYAKRMLELGAPFTYSQQEIHLQYGSRGYVTCSQTMRKVGRVILTEDIFNNHFRPADETLQKFEGKVVGDQRLKAEAPNNQDEGSKKTPSAPNTGEVPTE